MTRFAGWRKNSECKNGKDAVFMKISINNISWDLNGIVEGRQETTTSTKQTVM